MLDIQKHKFILFQILKDIYTDNEIGTILGFKGGTCAFIFYDLPRFSVDLDFNLLDIAKKDLVFKKIKKFLPKYGKLKDAREKRYTLFFLLSYGENDVNIKVEITKRKFADDYKVKNYLGISMLVMEKKDMLAHKLAALLGRENMANRDIFDLWFFMNQHWPVDRKIVEMQTKMTWDKYLEKCIQVIQKIDNKYILQGMGELLDEKQKKWAKENLKKDLLFLLNYYLENY